MIMRSMIVKKMSKRENQSIGTVSIIIRTADIYSRFYLKYDEQIEIWLKYDEQSWDLLGENIRFSGIRYPMRCLEAEIPERKIFSSYRKLRFPYGKTLRQDAHCARQENAADADASGAGVRHGAHFL